MDETIDPTRRDILKTGAVMTGGALLYPTAKKLDLLKLGTSVKPSVFAEAVKGTTAPSWMDSLITKILAEGTEIKMPKEPNILIENLNIWPEIYNYSVLFGMNKYLAYFLCQNTIAFFSSVSCIKVSTLGNLFLIRFIFKIFKKNTLSAMLICFLPQYNLKILLCLLGYYRYRFKKRN